MVELSDRADFNDRFIDQLASDGGSGGQGGWGAGAPYAGVSPPG